MPSSIQSCWWTTRSRAPVSNATLAPGGRLTSTILSGDRAPSGETLRRSYPELGSRHTGLLGVPGDGARRVDVHAAEERRERNAEAGGDLVEDGRSRAALRALDE